MKKLLILFFIGMMGLSSVSRADDFDPLNPDTISRTNNGTAPVRNNTVPEAVTTPVSPVQTNVGCWVFQVNAETGFPTGDLNNVANEGWGSEGSFGYRFPQNITVSLESGYAGYSAKNSVLNTTWDLIPIVLKGQYNFGNAGIQPYVFLGAGIALNSQSSSFAGPTFAKGETDFLVEAGLGISFAVAPQIYLYVQTKIEIDNTSVNYAADQPTVLIPLDIGLNILAY
jgi:hypothetical protein